MSTVAEQHVPADLENGRPLYAYGVMRTGQHVPAVTGVLGSRVEVVEADGLAVLVSPLADDRVRAKRRDLLAHSDVLQAAHDRGVVLPLRFGMLFASEPELRRELVERRGRELRRLLEEFEGLCELRVRASYHDQESALAAAVKGDAEIARLRGRARANGASQADLMRLGELVSKRYEAQRAADAETVLARLAPVAVDVRADDPDGELDVLKASFLLRVDARPRFDEQLEAVALRLRHLVRFTAIGPLPPHSFVAIGDAGGG
jgi:hypothetical protein